MQKALAGAEGLDDQGAETANSGRRRRPRRLAMVTDTGVVIRRSLPECIAEFRESPLPILVINKPIAIPPFLRIAASDSLY